MSDITWHNETRRLSDLLPWEQNPKRLTVKQGEHLTVSLDKFGQVLPFAISPDNDIYDGHQRRALMTRMKDYGPDGVVDVRVSSRPLTDDERRELIIRLRENQADWDFDLLGNLYEVEELQEWGFDTEKLGMFGDDEKQPPNEFTEYDESIETEYCCPKCGYKWSGNPE